MRETRTKIQTHKHTYLYYICIWKPLSQSNQLANESAAADADLKWRQAGNVTPGRADFTSTASCKYSTRFDSTRLDSKSFFDRFALWRCIRLCCVCLFKYVDKNLWVNVLSEKSFGCMLHNSLCVFNLYKRIMRNLHNIHLTYLIKIFFYEKYVVYANCELG